METKKLFFMECHLAGRQYHDANEVWDSLKIGTVLALERDPDNKYDHEAILLKFVDPDTQNEYKLGYIPSVHNSQLAALMDMGWGDIFECRISQINPQEHYERQIRITLQVKKRA